MKPFTRLVLSIGMGLLAMVLVGLFAFTLAKGQTAQRDDAMKKYGGQIAPVVVAVRDIPANRKISAEDVAVKKWVVALLPRDTYAKVSEVASKTTESMIIAGEPISAARLGGQSAFSLEVPDGLSAVSIPSQDVLAVGGAVRRGSKVDIYASTDQDAFILADDVLVLSTSSDTADSETAGALSTRGALTWVTIAVPSDKVGPVIRASEGNTLHLVLKGISAASGASTSSTVTSGN